MKNRALSVVSKALLPVLAISLAMHPFTVSAAHATEHCDASKNPRGALVGEFERQLDAAGGKENWTYRDNARRALSLSEFETRAGKQFFLTTPDGFEFYVQSDASDDEMIMVIYVKEGAEFKEFRRTSFPIDQSLKGFDAQLKKERRELTKQSTSGSWSGKHFSFATFIIALVASIVGITSSVSLGSEMGIQASVGVGAMGCFLAFAIMGLTDMK